jgi:hypothetical protein
MSDFDRNLATARTGYRTDQVAIDAGLRAHMIRVYNYMACRRGADRRWSPGSLSSSAAAIQVSGGHPD